MTEMQFLISVIDSQTGTATTAEMTAIHAFNDRLVDEGHWVVTAPDHDRAVMLATEASKACNRRVELRALAGAERP